MKVGDKVIVTKNNWFTAKPNLKRKGTLVKIFQVDNKTIYRVYFYDEKSKYTDGCNIFIDNGEIIELDIQEIRDIKIQQLLT